MASLLPSEISSGLSAVGGDLAGFFRNADSVVQSVSSIYDQITGKSQSVPSQSGQTYAQSPTVADPVPVPVPVKVSETKLLDSGSTLAIGAVILVGVLLLLSD